MVTRAPSRATSLLALFAAVALLLTACSDDSGDSASTDTTAPAEGGATTTTLPAGEAPTDSPAAGVRADLTALLEEQVYLTAFLVEQAAAAGGDVEAPEAVATAAAAAESSADLSEIIGAAYGVEGQAAFLEAWDAHRQAIIDVALADGDADAVDAARGEVVATLEELDPDADFAAVAEGLAASDDLLVSTVEELAAGSLVDLRAPAEPMPEVALGLASIIDEHSALEGEADSDESALRADLTGLMQESALLTGVALAETAQEGGDASAPAPAFAFTNLEENTAALAEVLMADATAQAEFEALWGGHIDSFRDYAVATQAGDAPGIADAEDALDAFRDDLGALLADEHPALSAPAVAEELVPHTDSILAYADAVVAEETAGEEATETPESPALLRDAALAMRLAARTFAGGLTAPTATE